MNNCVGMTNTATGSTLYTLEVPRLCCVLFKATHVKIIVTANSVFLVMKFDWLWDDLGDIRGHHNHDDEIT